MGDKATARQTMKGIGVPITPGSDGTVDDEETAIQEAKRIGYPVLIKATAGGGGRGMRVARNESELLNAYNTARAEAEAAFKNSAVYLERYIERPDISRSRYSAMATATSSISESVSARFSAGTRS
jgi:acetyl-CoA carboxylase biotin carboxylase subunit